MKALIACCVALTLAATAVVVPAFAATTKKVTLKEDAFSVKTLKVKKGTKVTWAFKDGGIAHNVTVDVGPKKFHSKDQTHGTFSETLTKPGTYHIICTIHINEGMQMEVKVS